MRKSFYLSIILVFNTLYANELDNLTELYKQKKYKLVYQKVKTYLKQNPLSIRANVLLANSFYMLGDLDRAMTIYDRVLIINPNHIYSKIQEAKIYIQYSYYDMAILELDSLLAQDLTIGEKKAVLELRKSIVNKKSSQDIVISEKQNKYDIKGALSLGILYDTNANSDIGEKSFKIPAYNLDYKGVKKQKKMAHIENITLSKDTNLYNSLNLLTSVDIYNKTYFDSDVDNDLTYAFFDISPYYEYGDFRVFTPIVLNKVFLNYDSYLNTYGGGIDLKRYIKNGLLETGYRYYANRYYGINKDKDSNNHSAYMGMRYIAFSDVLTYMYINYANNREKKDLRTDISYDSYGINLGISKKIALALRAKASFSFKKYDYKDFNKVFLNKREDEVYSYNIGLVYDIAKKSAINFDINYINKDSNQFLHDYDRFLTSLNYTYKF